MGQDNFFKNSFFLTASNIATGILGFIFSIYLADIAGPEGVALYGLVMPIYNLFICLMTAGIIAAISQRAAIYESKGEYNNLFKTIRSVAFFNIIWAIAIGLIVFFLAPYISQYGIKDPRTINAIKVTCPAMVFIALSNILKGFFYGSSKIKIPAVIDISEKAMRIITITLLIWIFHAKTLSSIVTLAYVSLALGELQSLLLLYGYYRYTVNRIPPSYEKPESKAQLLFNVLIISLPLCLNGFLGNAFSTISTLIVPRQLVASGLDYSSALNLIGRFNGMALTIVTFPLIVVNSINTLLVPDLSQSISNSDYYNASVRIKTVLKIAFLLGMATTVICQLIPDSLGQMFYKRDDLGLYIRLASLSAPIFFVANTMFGILNGLNRQSIILRNSIIISITEIVCLYIFTAIPSINIFSYVITIFVTSTLGLIINLHEVNKHIELNLSLFNIIIFILTGILVYLMLNLFTNRLLDGLFISKNIIVIVLTFGIFAYLSRFGLEED
ncbi:MULTISPECIES: stage V sporulation protein B [unclassified Clostridium]|uniref:stage V sporulation protein B n=1 Tax=Clostridium TaxID=1485 RepID=UPI001C8BC670|nr:MULTISPECIES: stage V sporulation protein B [unclassified Clostridium]MBX9138518.1 stage V sporulation protein B [Clostridium sp. K12(2020)]MBX9145257.1 stage V sporulation protein B [Clostridium sp. K13]MDU2288832.1 stage V sporulation protein B [Clostridium celatum]